MCLIIRINTPRLFGMKCLLPDNLLNILRSFYLFSNRRKKDWEGRKYNQTLTFPLSSVGCG